MKDVGSDQDLTPHIPAGKRIHGTQGVVLAWCIWLIGSWLITLGFESALVASQLMMPYVALTGLTLLWPMLRLSQWREVRSSTDQVSLPLARDGAAPAAAGPTAQPHYPPSLPASVILREWLCLNLVSQAVIWPLMINARWSIWQTLCLDGLLASWSLLAGAIIRWGGHLGTGWGRSAAMTLCLLLVYGEPAVMGLLNMFADRDLTWRMRISPIQTVWHVTQLGWSHLHHHDAIQVVSAGLAAMTGWLGLALFQPTRVPSR